MTLAILLINSFSISAGLGKLEKVEEGWLLTDEQLIKVAQEIENIKYERDVALAENKALKDLAAEYELQLENLNALLAAKEKENRYKRFDDTLTGAGIASLLILIAGSQK